MWSRSITAHGPQELARAQAHNVILLKRMRLAEAELRAVALSA
jgi:hypothetical protein